MTSITSFVDGLYAVVNPWSPQQLFLFYLWLFLFTGSSVALIVSERRLTRLFAWVVNSLFSFGMLQAGIVSVAIAATHWQVALAVAALTACGSFYACRPRA